MKHQNRQPYLPGGTASRAARSLAKGLRVGVFIVAPGISMIQMATATKDQRPVAQEDATFQNPRVKHNASHPAATPQGADGRGENGFECTSLRSRVAPSRVFSELRSSVERLVALDPIARRQHRILVAKRSPSQSDLSSAIPIGAGRGAIRTDRIYTCELSWLVA